MVIVRVIIGLPGRNRETTEKDPPINEDMIKALMMQMGRKPNQKQINQMMKQMNKFM